MDSCEAFKEDLIAWAAMLLPIKSLFSFASRLLIEAMIACCIVLSRLGSFFSDTVDSVRF